MTTKQDILKALEALPEDADFLDAIDRLVYLYKIQRGIKDADAGKIVSQEEARARMTK
jgi:predicted transcriptional regulator